MPRSVLPNQGRLQRGTLTINVRRAGKATILDLSGPLKMGESEKAFRHQVEELLGAGTTNLAVNLAGVPAMDSAGIGALIHTLSGARAAGGKCKFFAPSKRVWRTLKMVRLDKVIELVEDEATALASF